VDSCDNILVDGNLSFGIVSDRILMEIAASEVFRLLPGVSTVGLVKLTSGVPAEVAFRNP
jgi:hypothetical protein